MNESNELAERVKLIKKAMLNGSVGPLIASGHVRWLSENWSRFEDFAVNRKGKKVGLTTWLRMVSSKDLSYFRRRWTAVEILGEASRRTIDHEVAVWLVQSFEDPVSRNKVRERLIEECVRTKNGNPLSLPMAKRVAREVLGLVGQGPKVCPTCEKLREILKAHGISEVSEVPVAAE